MSVLNNDYLSIKTDFEKMDYLEERCGVEIVSYGLAPNPTGYCYEIINDDRYESMEDEWIEELNRMCDTAPQGFLN